MDKPNVTIIIPTYNDEEHLQHLFLSLDNLEFDEPYEVIVIDDCSTDSTSDLCHEWTKKWHPYEFRYYRLDQNCGPGCARNKGLELARSDIVAFTDSDCRVHPLWLKNLIAGLNIEQKIVGAGGRVKAVSNSTIFARHALFHRVLEPPEKLHYLVTCNCCFLKKALLEVGGFPEDIRNPGGEDIASCILLWKKGFRFSFQKDAIVYHDFDTSFNAFLKTWYNYGYGCSLVLHRLLKLEEIYANLESTTDINNYWPGYLMLPPTTGIRSAIRDIKYQFNKLIREKTSIKDIGPILFLTFCQRISHLLGWRKARKIVLGR